jgi:CHAT domain-containing protein/tetratricopeptide (TPR) repeat protein
MARIACVVVAIACASAALWSQGLPAPRIVSALLKPGETVEGQLASGQSQEYRVILEANQYVRVTVEQRSINVAVACIGPDGGELSRINSFEIGDAEEVELIAGVPGVYRLQLRASDPHAATGLYQVALRDIEPATERHNARVRAARAVDEAMALKRQGSHESTLKAIKTLQQALMWWTTAQDLVQQARTLYTIGLSYIEAGDQQQALEYTSAALPVARASLDFKVQGRALDSVAEVQNYFGDKRKAIAYYEQALPLLRNAADRAGEGHTLNNLAVAYSGTGDKRKALSLFDQAMDAFRELHDRAMSAEVVGNIGMTYESLGEYHRALEHHHLLLTLERDISDHAGEAIALNNIATAYTGLGEFQKALDAYTAALEINRTLDNRRNIAINLNNIAWVHDNLGDRQRALKVYQEALEIVRTVKDQRTTAVVLNNIAEIQANAGDIRKAVELHNQALSLRRAVGHADGEANSLNNLGKAYAKLGGREQARDYFERALAIHRTSGNLYMMARTLTNLGALERDAGDHQRALPHLNEALQLSRSIHDRTGEAEALGQLAREESARGNLDDAHRLADASLAAMESVRLAVASPRLRASFFASARDVQELDIGVLMRLNAERPAEDFGATALFTSERGKARSLLELLAEAGVEIRQGVDAALVDRERELSQLVSAKAEQQTLLLAGKHTNVEAAASEKELETITAEFEQTQSRIRETSPKYAALTQPGPLDLKDIQSRVLDDDTVLLEYALGTPKSFLWAVTPTSVDIFELASRAEIESAARRVYDLLTARNQRLERETSVARAARIRQADEGFISAAARLSGMLLGPAGLRLGDKRLLIVGEGVLQYLPFTALPEPTTDPAGAASRSPLIVKHEIVTIPSASVVAVLRQERAGRKQAPKTLAVLADPVFSADDARVVHQKNDSDASTKPGSVSDVMRSDAGQGAQEFVRLRFSRHEAEEIARLAGEGTLKMLDFDASRDAVMKADLGQYRIVHFATHSVLNNLHPDLSGVVLSLVGRSGRSQNGFLRLYDIYNLRLASDLVVLSACETALGEEVKGEGLIGLTRGFFYAGAASVVASLWQIDDRTSAEIMKRFYEGMLTRNQRPAAALRAAQIAMWRINGWDAPYYWAAFTLQGEWR